MNSRIIFYQKDNTKLNEVICKNDNAPTNWRKIYKLSLPHGLSAKIIIEAKRINDAEDELTRILKARNIDSAHITYRRTEWLNH